MEWTNTAHFKGHFALNKRSGIQPRDSFLSRIFPGDRTKVLACWCLLNGKRSNTTGMLAAPKKKIESFLSSFVGCETCLSKPSIWPLGYPCRLLFSISLTLNRYSATLSSDTRGWIKVSQTKLKSNCKVVIMFQRINQPNVLIRCRYSFLDCQFTYQFIFLYDCFTLNLEFLKHCLIKVDRKKWALNQVWLSMSMFHVVSTGRFPRWNWVAWIHSYPLHVVVRSQYNYWLRIMCQYNYWHIIILSVWLVKLW